MTDVESFKNTVYSIVKSIPYGKVLTYGQIAWLAEKPRNSRLVGKLLHGAPSGIPCHRVVNCKGRTAPYWKEQAERLQAEGVEFKSNNYVEKKKYNYNIFNHNPD